jgi:hypothetical protein
VHGEADCRDDGSSDLEELQLPGDPRLVELVGQLAAEAGKEDEGKHEDRACRRNVNRAIMMADGRQYEEDQEVLEEVVIKSRQGLREEERHKPLGENRTVGHFRFWSLLTAGRCQELN